jgi:hypothetical protein
MTTPLLNREIYPSPAIDRRESAAAQNVTPFVSLVQ